jgi:hypothetical protein
VGAAGAGAAGAGAGTRGAAGAWAPWAASAVRFNSGTNSISLVVLSIVVITAFNLYGKTSARSARL